MPPGLRTASGRHRRPLPASRPPAAGPARVRPGGHRG